MNPTDSPGPKPTGSVKSSHDRILDSAKELFAARGYENATTAAIARRAGTSESQLIKHFGNKQGLLEQIFATGWSGITNAARKAMADCRGPEEKLVAITRAVFECLDQDQELKLLVLLEARRIRREGSEVGISEGFLGFVRLLDGVIEEMKADGQLRPSLEPQAVRSALMGMVEGMLRDQFLAQRVGYPAEFGSEDVKRIFHCVVAAFIVPEKGPDRNEQEPNRT